MALPCDKQRGVLASLRSPGTTNPILCSGKNRDVMTGVVNTEYDSTYASVRIYGAGLDPLTVTQILRLPPDHTHRTGEPRIRRMKSGEVREFSPYRQGMWGMSSKDWVASTRLDDHLVWLLDQLEPRAVGVAELLAQGITVNFFCYSSGNTATPPSISETVRNRAVALGIEIDIDHYNLGANGEEDADVQA